MEANHTIGYDVSKSAGRIDDILNASNKNYEDSETIPKRSDLTFTNGYYVNVTALFIDIVGSSDMTDEHKRPTLAKMYRSFISECVAIMNASYECKEVNIHGDCVWGVFETPLKSNIDAVFEIAGKLNSLIKILNYKLEKKGYSRIDIGIGMDYGRVLMVKAGYSGSSINDIVWMGDAINQASHACGKAGRNGKDVLFLTSDIYNNLKEDYQKLLKSYTDIYGDWSTYYTGNIIDLAMNSWYEENCK